ncbi:hypothetical protein C3737_04280 [Aeromonas jandaei]|nr:hypothetical protein C3737_04280 [Aeromonas jandaei]
MLFEFHRTLLNLYMAVSLTAKFRKADLRVGFLLFYCLLYLPYYLSCTACFLSALDIHAMQTWPEL